VKKHLEKKRKKKKKEKKIPGSGTVNLQPW
jgi:hypothetical protein